MTKIKKVVMCSGKIYYDLIEAREKLKMIELIYSELNNFILFRKNFSKYFKKI